MRKTTSAVKEIDPSIKFAWAFLLQHGQILIIEGWNYYGGFNKSTYGHDYSANQAALNKVTAQAISVGIDWDKSGVPEVEQESTTVLSIATLATRL